METRQEATIKYAIHVRNIRKYTLLCRGEMAMCMWNEDFIHVFVETSLQEFVFINGL